MGDRLTRIYTRTGDTGSTGLADGERRQKHDPRVNCLGEVDELNACIGLAVSGIADGDIKERLLEVQHDLFDVGAELSQPGKQLLDADYVTALEAVADQFNASLAPLKEFILPGGSPSVAALHLARTVCRRAERSVAALAESEPVNPETCRYLNRLSDLLFIFSRAAAQHGGNGETMWNSRYSRLQRG